MEYKEKNYEEVVPLIRTIVREYIVKHNIKSLVIGVSGGLDSAVNCVLLKPVCDDLNIPLIGYYIHIETNKPEEASRAENIGKYFCTTYESVDLTSLYKTSLPVYMKDYNTLYIGDGAESKIYDRKIRMGNLKARSRMKYLREQAAYYHGILVDNDNKTEHQLGFWTLDGDVGDITPMFDLWKTEVFGLARFLMTMLIDEGEIEALQDVINAIPTDGLGITSSDVEQFGCSSYDEVDDILQQLLIDVTDGNFYERYSMMCDKYGEDKVSHVWKRHLNSNFKRNHPYRIFLS